MAGIPWAKYERTDWIRIPGGSRRYRSLINPDVTISRRQYDEHYGSASFFGTYEKKARINAASPAQLLRPARGRSSARNLTPAQKESEINRRRIVKQETQQQKLIQRLTSKKSRLPKKIDLRNFPKGKQIRKFRTDVSLEEIESIRQGAEKSGIVFGYWVGLEMVSERDGQMKTPTLFSQRDIYVTFTRRDMDKAMAMAQQKSYATLTGMWIALHLKSSAAKKNGAKIK